MVKKVDLLAQMKAELVDNRELHLNLVQKMVMFKLLLVVLPMAVMVVMVVMDHTGKQFLKNQTKFLLTLVVQQVQTLQEKMELQERVELLTKQEM